MCRYATHAFALFVTAGTCLSAHAQVSLVSQNRYVRVFDQDQPSATDFGQYDAFDQETIDVGTFGPSPVTISATQSSEFVGTQWTGSGAVSLSGDLSGGGAPFTFEAQSFIDVVFDVSSTIDANLAASADFMTGVEIEGDVLLVDITGGGFNPIAGISFDLASPVNTDVTLAPGQYRFLAFMDALPQNDYIGTVNGSFAYDFSLTFVPAPASTVLLGLGGLFATRRRR